VSDRTIRRDANVLATAYPVHIEWSRARAAIAVWIEDEGSP
jgi:hypothetical protein